MNFTVTLNKPASAPLTVNAVQIGNNTNPYNYGPSNIIDFVAQERFVTFATGETTKTVSVTINSDANNEKNETFVVVIGNPSRPITFARQVAVGTIINDDGVTPTGPDTMQIWGSDITEGNNGTKMMYFNVTLGQPAIKAASVTAEVKTGTENCQRADGTCYNTNAIRGTDFEQVTRTVNFAVGEMNKIMAVPIKGDTIAEGTDSLMLLLTSWPYDYKLTHITGHGKILNDD